MRFQQGQHFASDTHPSMIHVLVAAHDSNKNIIACVAPAGNHFLHRHRVIESAGADNFQAERAEKAEQRQKKLAQEAERATRCQQARASRASYERPRVNEVMAERQAGLARAKILVSKFCGGD